MLSLKQFMLRRQVLQLYQDIMKTIRTIPDESQRKELTLWVRQEFRNQKHITDEESIRMMLTKGKMTFKQMCTTLDLVK
ncbi:LYR motif-containing protein 2-like [Antedon mediterranea]|uniref:LYR motif-containing protein 2-like n=1 Tax=Antedon mediterranea TaxID=105859 RepID=UPI003AF8BBC4